MPKLTQYQIDEALKQGVSQDQINNYMGKDAPKKQTPAEVVGDIVGVKPLGEVIGRGIAALTPIPKVVKPVTYKGTQESYQNIQQNQYMKDVKAEMPGYKEVAAGAAKTGLTLAGLKTPPIASTLKGRVLEFGVLGGTFQALDNIEKGNPIGKGVGGAAAFAGAIPLVGTGIKKGLSKLFTGTAQRIEMSLIKPTKVDIEDGFKVANIQKYGITGNLTQKAQKIEQLLSDKTKILHDKLASRTDATVDLVKVFNNTSDDLLKNKGKMFGESEAVNRVLQRLGGEIDNVSGNGLVDLSEAQVIKQMAGKKGAWVFGNVDPDARATEMVYSKFYRTLKQEIEKNAPAGVKEINREIGDLIPIMHAIIRRIPVAERNNALSITDIIAGGFAIGNPKAMGLFALNRALKSGQVANVLGKAGGALDDVPKSNIGQRVFGRPLSQGEIPNYFDNPTLGLAIKDVSKTAAQQADDFLKAPSKMKLFRGENAANKGGVSFTNVQNWAKNFLGKGGDELSGTLDVKNPKILNFFKSGEMQKWADEAYSAGKTREKDVYEYIFQKGGFDAILQSDSRNPDILEVLVSPKHLKSFKPSKAVGRVVKSISSQSDDLLKEARKYKSAEEFVRGQTPYYHGTKTDFKVFDQSKTDGAGFYFTRDKNAASDFAKQAGGNVVKESYIVLKNPAPKDEVIKAFAFSEGKGKTFKESTTSLSKQVKEILSKKGYDGYYGELLPTGKGYAETVAFNPDSILTKSQLTEIWKKAKGSIAKKIHPDDLAVMNDFTEYVAKEYKPANSHQLELDASRIAENYGIKQPKTLQGLANEFGRVLEKYGFKR